MNTPPGPKSIRIDEAVHYFIFIYDVVLLDYLKERDYWWDTYLNNECIKNHNGRLVMEVLRICR